MQGALLLFEFWVSNWQTLRTSIPLVSFDLFSIFLVVAIQNLHYNLFGVVALHLMVPLNHVMAPVLLIKVNWLVSLRGIGWWDAISSFILEHFVLLKLDAITEHLVSQVLIKVDVDLLDGSRVDREIGASMYPIVVEWVADRVLLFQVLVENTKTLVLVIIK